MTLVETYRAVAPSIVAFISRSAKTEESRLPLAPTILGTGFFVHEDGIVATNRHVAEEMDRLPLIRQPAAPATVRCYSIMARPPKPNTTANRRCE